jgi:hypothetical protein
LIDEVGDWDKEDDKEFTGDFTRLVEMCDVKGSDVGLALSRA